MDLAPFVRQDGDVHPTIDYEKLVATFPDHEPDLWIINSPSRLIAWHELRERYRLTRFDPVPCDVFVWSLGDAPDPRMTRVGGTPFLPRRVSWPKIHGADATFLCQFDFRDSTDLVGKLPGDLLLVFVADLEDSPIFGDADDMHFEWVSATETDLWAAADVPHTTDLTFVTAWGVRYRTCDLPGAWEAAYEIDPENLRHSELPVLWATKIGGIPYASQDNLDEAPAGYLCQLVSIQAASGAWPWCNRQAPLPNSFEDGVHADHHEFMIGDLGELTFCLQPDGSITTDSSCG